MPSTCPLHLRLLLLQQCFLLRLPSPLICSSRAHFFSSLLSLPASSSSAAAAPVFSVPPPLSSLSLCTDTANRAARLQCLQLPQQPAAAAELPRRVLSLISLSLLGASAPESGLLSSSSFLSGCSALHTQHSLPASSSSSVSYPLLAPRRPPPAPSLPRHQNTVVQAAAFSSSSCGTVLPCSFPPSPSLHHHSSTLRIGRHCWIPSWLPPPSRCWSEIDLKSHVARKVSLSHLIKTTVPLALSEENHFFFFSSIYLCIHHHHHQLHQQSTSRLHLVHTVSVTLTAVLYTARVRRE